MDRIYSEFVYGDGPRSGCWWDATCDLPTAPEALGDVSCDVAIVGAGFTGLSAALELARQGQDVVVLEAEQPGWGASGRNGGFCCLGGGRLNNGQLDARYGLEVRKAWRRTEVAAVEHVREFLKRTGTDADEHSAGETLLAHRSRDMRGLESAAQDIKEDYGVEASLHDCHDLERRGMSAGFFGGLTTPIGVALNPRKYIGALVSECMRAGVRVFGHSPAKRMVRDGAGWRLDARGARVAARQVLIATNGYSSETLPPWLRGRYLPTQSSILVTRPISAEEQAEQGWSSLQMCYDTRNLLHYFRLMPDGRMLFGMRGGLGGTAASEARARRRVLAHFRHMFPAWDKIDVTHQWSGMVCLAEHFLPFVGPVPEQDGVWCAMCYHGNGVSMGSYSGHLAAAAMLGRDTRPAAVAQPLSRFPLPGLRRYLLWPAYLGYRLADL